jgi:hypothetical protein
MKTGQIILVIIVVILTASLINYLRDGYFAESIFRVIPGLGGRELSIYDLAGILCVGWVIYRIIRLNNREK